MPHRIRFIELDPNRAVHGRKWMIRRIAARAGTGGPGRRIDRSSAEGADELPGRAGETDVNGLGRARAVIPGSFQDVVLRVVAELQWRGTRPLEHPPGALQREPDGGRDRLPASPGGERHRPLMRRPA